MKLPLILKTNTENELIDRLFRFKKTNYILS